MSCPPPYGSRRPDAARFGCIPVGAITLEEMLYYVHFTLDRMAPYPPLEAMHKVKADSPVEAAAILLRALPPPVENDGDGFGAQVAIETKNGRVKRALSIPLVREGTIPIDLGLAVEGGL